MNFKVYTPVFTFLSVMLYTVGVKAQSIKTQDSLLRDSLKATSKRAEQIKVEIASNSIKGVLVDSVTKKPLDYITVGLRTGAGLSRYTSEYHMEYE